METFHKWEHLADLREDMPSRSSSDLTSLATIWAEQLNKLQAREAIAAFNERLCREWAIETGVIENLYHIDRGVTQLLIERGIETSLIPHNATDKPAEEVVAIVRDHRDALEGLFSFVRQERRLSKSYICELHQQMTQHQAVVSAQTPNGELIQIPLEHGKFKSLPNNPVRPGEGLHEYCPPEHVDAEMDQLIALHEDHYSRGVNAEVKSAWLHHRFTQIHPFQDGNGRIARAIASLVFIRDGYFPLVITRDQRTDYLDALAVADNGDLGSLVSMFVKIQKACFLKALSVSEDVIRAQDSVSVLMDAAVKRLTERKDERAAAHSAVFDLCELLERYATHETNRVAVELTAHLRTVGAKFNAVADRSDLNNDFWFKSQIVNTARNQGYFADTRTYKAWVRLRIFEERQTSIVFSFHSVGTSFVGILGVSAFLEYRDLDDETRHAAPDGPYDVSSEIFEFSYLDDTEAVQERFKTWIRHALTLALDQWRRQL